MEHYFAGFIKRSGMSGSRFWELGRREGGDDKSFFMNILAFKMSRCSNAVSRIHGQVSRRMWRDIWKGFYESDVPIRNITNGVHILSWIAPRMKELLDAYIGMDWEHHLTNSEQWAKIQDIPDTLLWRVRYELKQRLINLLREYIVRHWEKFNYTKTWREELYAKINPAAMIIGFARRFAPYKRADILLSNLDRLDRILNHPTRPVRIIYAGKAHPNDEMGKNLVKKVMDACRDERFQGKIFFLEDYDIRLARYLVRGVDLWLNTPRRPYEASGTSGIKAAANGVLHMSTSDGWWPEAYDGMNGWVVGPVVRELTEDKVQADLADSESLYALLENTVIPTFYEREISGLPEKWLAMIKHSMQTLIPAFSTERMLAQYAKEMYCPAARRERELTKDNYILARYLADWKGKLPMRFSSIRLLDMAIEGIHGDTIAVSEPLSIQARLDPGKLEEKDILVEMLIGKRDNQGFIKDPEYVPLKLLAKGTDGSLTYEVEYRVPDNGSYGFGVRVMPFNPQLSGKQELGLVLWW
jgi:phosphorylase/glycogen(starch) synthase